MIDFTIEVAEQCNLYSLKIYVEIEDITELDALSATIVSPLAQIAEEIQARQKTYMSKEDPEND